MVAALRESLHFDLRELSQTLHDYTRTERRQAFLDEQVVKFNHHNEFYTITDLKDGKIIWDFRIRECLGYELTKESEMGQLDAYVLPHLRSWYQALIIAGIKAFIETETRTVEYHFDISVPMRRANGEWWLVKSMTMPFDYDDQKRPTTIIQSFLMVEPYQHGAVGLLVDGPDTGQVQNIQAAIQKGLLKYVRTPLALTRGQIQIVRIIRDLRRENAAGTAVTDEEIAKKFVTDREVGLKEVRKMNRALSAFKERLLLLMHDPTLGEGEPHFFLKEAPPMFVIDWFETAGFIALMEAYVKEHHPKRMRGLPE